MEQYSHQILRSGFAFSAFAICRDPDGFGDIGRRLLKSKDNRTGVIGLVSAFVDGTRQYERRGMFTESPDSPGENPFGSVAASTVSAPKVVFLDHGACLIDSQVPAP